MTQKLAQSGTLRSLQLAGICWFAMLAACSSEDSRWDDERWQLAVTVEPDHLRIQATIADIHGDYIHMSIRREGHENGYTIERSPAPNQTSRDWSRVHHWFGDMYPDTYLEGRIDDGSGAGPSDFQTFSFKVPRGVTQARSNYPDEGGSDYTYITRGYSYADGNNRHPSFPSGNYEIEIYAWYTGKSQGRHPAIDGSDGVQFVHYEHHITSVEFTIE